MVAVTPDARRAFTANIGSGTVSVLDLAAGRKLRDIAVGGQPEGIALTPDGRTLWVGDLEGARVQAFDTATLRAAGGGAHRRRCRSGSRRARTGAGSSPPTSAAAASPSSTRARARSAREIAVSGEQRGGRR